MYVSFSRALTLEAARVDSQVSDRHVTYAGFFAYLRVATPLVAVGLCCRRCGFRCPCALVTPPRGAQAWTSSLNVLWRCELFLG